MKNQKIYIPSFTIQQITGCDGLIEVKIMVKALETIAGEHSRRTALLALGLAGLGAAFTGCGGNSGGGGGGGNGTKKDTTPPGKIDDLAAYASTQYGERVTLEFTQPGDDGYAGMPQNVVIKVSKNPITSETEWTNAYTLATLAGADIKNGGSNRTLEYDLSQIAALVADGLNSGDLYFSVRASDEANNIGPLSNSPTDYIPSKAEFYVDKWLPSGGDINLDYGESVLVIRGDAAKGIDARADPLAQILINTDDSNGIPFLDQGLTWQGIRDVLLQYTDGQLVVNGNSELADSTEATTLNSSMLYNCLIRVWDPAGGEVLRNQKFQNLTQSEWESVRDLHRDALVQIVSALPENYNNLDPSYDPGW